MFKVVRLFASSQTNFLHKNKTKNLISGRETISIKPLPARFRSTSTSFRKLLWTVLPLSCSNWIWAIEILFCWPLGNEINNEPPWANGSEQRKKQASCMLKDKIVWFQKKQTNFYIEWFEIQQVDLDRNNVFYQTSTTSWCWNATPTRFELLFQRSPDSNAK